MGSKDKSMKLTTPNKSEDTNKVTIDSLNDDTLINIFDYLTIKDKYQIEFVCKKWSQLAKSLWSHVTKLNISECVDKNKTAIEKANFLINVLKRCGKYLCEININKYENYPKIEELLQAHSHQLTSLTLDDEKINEKFLETLFEKSSSNLRSLTLKNLNMNGKFLSKLGSNLQELTIEKCDFKSKASIKSFMSNLKNLTKFEIIHTCDIIEFLNLNTCENIKELFLDAFSKRQVEMNLTNFISNQKQLHKLTLNFILLDKIIVDKVPRDHLKELKLNFYSHLENPSFNFRKLLERLTNLETVSFNQFECNDIYIRAILNSVNEQNIKNIEISFDKFEYRYDTEIDRFSDLKKLEYFKISGECHEPSDSAYMLENLLKCENLKYLHIQDSELCEGDFEHLKEFKNLVTLRITVSMYDHLSYEIDDDDICDVFKKSVNLKELELHNFENPCDEFINKIDKVKNERKDSHKLKIILKNCKINTCNLKNISPLIYVFIMNEK